MNKVSEPDSLLRYGRNEGEDLALWTHFAAFGGEDKNRMVTVTTWMLGLSSAILWYILVSLMSDDARGLTEPRRALFVSTLGASISFTAAFVVLLYSGYSNHNWHLADEIARARGWEDLRPEHSQGRLPAKGVVNKAALALARPCRPLEQQAPIFWLFLMLSLALFALHVAVFVLAALSISERL